MTTRFRQLAGKSFLGVFILLSAVTFLIYTNTFDAPFLFDDYTNIVDNPLVRLTELSWSTVSNILKSRSTYRPFANFTFALNYYVHQYDVCGYHIINLLIHILTGFLVYLLARQTLVLIRKPSPFFALLAALFWLVNPVHTQSVTYIVQRMNSLAAMLYLLALVCYIQARQIQSSQADGIRKPVLLLAAALLSAILALASKEIAATLPLMLFLYEWYFFQNLEGRWLKRKSKWIASFAVLSAVVVLIYLGNDPVHRILAPYNQQSFTPLQRLLSEPLVIVYYLSLLVFPHPSRLILDYDFPVSTGLAEPLTTILAISAVMILIVLAVYAARKNRLISFAVLWFLGTLLIESSVIGLALIYEHRTYLPSVFPFIALAWLLFHHVKPQAVSIALVLLLVGMSAIWTWQRNSFWTDEYAFWQDNMKKSPHKARPLVALGRYAQKNKRFTEAKTYCQLAMDREPGYAEGYNIMGLILLDQDQPEQARHYFAKAMQLSGGDIQYLHNYAIALAMDGDTKTAIEQFRKIIAHSPHAAEAHYHLAGIYARQKSLDKAIAHYQKAIQHKPVYPKALTDLGNVLLMQGKNDQANQYFNTAIAQDPNYLPARLNLALSLKDRHPEQALPHIRRACELAPEDPKAQKLAGEILTALGNNMEARRHYEALVRIDPAKTESLLHLSRLYLAEKELSKATRVYERLAALLPDNPAVFYNLACLYARQNRTDPAVSALRRAISNGYSNWGHLRADPDLANLRDTAYYQSLVENANLLDEPGP